MKKALIILFVICSYPCLSQSLDCCQNKSEVENHLVGIWQKGEDFYKYSIIDGKLKGISVEYNEESQSYIKTKYSGYSLVEIEESDSGYDIIEATVYGAFSEEITFLDDKKLITKIGSDEYEYIKVSDQ